MGASIFVAMDALLLAPQSPEFIAKVQQLPGK